MNMQTNSFVPSFLEAHSCLAGEEILCFFMEPKGSLPHALERAPDCFWQPAECVSTSLRAVSKLQLHLPFHL
jgi:hypothetical protein